MADHIRYLQGTGGSCSELRPESCGIVIFGASGDLAHRKLLPSLFALYTRNLLPDEFFIIGCSRTLMSDNEFRADVVRTLTATSGDISDDAVNRFAVRCYYCAGKYDDNDLYGKLGSALDQGCRAVGHISAILYYLALPPILYSTVIRHLDTTGILSRFGTNDKARVIIEKPFGYDLNSAMALNAAIRDILTEDSIYRIDHYLGKETVQNILLFRFANAIFEPVWNQQYIDHVEITVAESDGIGHRAGYYDRTGHLRDMFQNHMLQMLSLVAMEPPLSFAADHVRDEKVRLLKAVQPFNRDNIGERIVRAQYTDGMMGGKAVPGYPDESGVAPASSTETYVAGKILIDNRRWQGVPFYVRSGKRLKHRKSNIAIVFREVSHSMFVGAKAGDLSRNVLVFDIHPEEGVSLTVEAKSPGPRLCTSVLALDVRYREVFGITPPNAYERLLLDCMHGDQTLFIRDDDMEAAWSLITPVLDIWSTDPELCPLAGYPAGSSGPEEAEYLLARDGQNWYSAASQYIRSD